MRVLRAYQIDVLDVSQVYFVNPPNAHNQTRNSPFLLGQYTRRGNQPLLQPVGWGSSKQWSFLNRFGSPVFRPEAVSELVAAHYPRPNNLFFPGRILDETPQWFVRANHYGHAFSNREVLDPENWLVEDDSILWVEPELYERFV